MSLFSIHFTHIELFQIDSMNSFNNTTVNGTFVAEVSAPPADYLIYFWIVYIAAGLPLTVLDSISFMAMVKRNSARLGNLFLVGLGFSDLVSSVAMFVSGIYRLIYTLLGLKDMLTSRLTCFVRLVTLWVLACEMTAILMLTSSIDRFRRIIFEKYLSKFIVKPLYYYM